MFFDTSQQATKAMRGGVPLRTGNSQVCFCAYLGMYIRLSVRATSRYNHIRYGCHVQLSIDGTCADPLAVRLIILGKKGSEGAGVSSKEQSDACECMCACASRVNHIRKCECSTPSLLLMLKCG